MIYVIIEVRQLLTSELENLQFTICKGIPEQSFTVHPKTWVNNKEQVCGIEREQFPIRKDASKTLLFVLVVLHFYYNLLHFYDIVHLTYVCVCLIDFHTGIVHFRDFKVFVAQGTAVLEKQYKEIFNVCWLGHSSQYRGKPVALMFKFYGVVCAHDETKSLQICQPWQFDKSNWPKSLTISSVWRFFVKI